MADGASLNELPRMTNEEFDKKWIMIIETEHGKFCDDIMYPKEMPNDQIMKEAVLGRRLIWYYKEFGGTIVDFIVKLRKIGYYEDNLEEYDKDIVAAIKYHYRHKNLYKWRLWVDSIRFIFRIKIAIRNKRRAKRAKKRGKGKKDEIVCLPKKNLKKEKPKVQKNGESTTESTTESTSSKKLHKEEKK